MDTVRSVLQPVTHNLPPPVRDFAISLLGDTCYQTLVLDIQLDNSDCLKLAVSKGLGIGIIGVSSIVKLPQILKLINSHSASGISFLSYLLETAAYLIGLAYNFRQGFPFSTYGETALIVAQNVVISVLVLQYGGKSAAAGALIAGLGAAGYALFSGGLIDMNMLSYFQAGAGVLGIASKAPQIWTIWQQGGTGQLSAFAVSFLFDLSFPPPASVSSINTFSPHSHHPITTNDTNRYSTTSSAPSPESSPPSKKSTTS
jgi:mannose-P-dolichol utilization defect protein 1